MPADQTRWGQARSSLFALLLAAAGAGAQTPLNLPDLGDPAAGVLSLSQEKRLAPMILRQLRAQLPVMEDLELGEYISALGNRLLAANVNNRLEFHFLLIDRPQINAFATPGGIIVINRGLILAADSESELASVLAHEISHVTQRHLARLLADAQNTSWSSYLAAVLTTLAAIYDARLAGLGAYASSALPIERALSYSRLFENEADNLGMRLLAAAGYNPAAMIRFFRKLQAQESGGRVPEFLRTHPLTIDRISNALNRSARYQGEYRENSDEFLFAKARLDALTVKRAVPVKSPTGTNARVEQYQRAVALLEAGQGHEAARLLEAIQQGDQPIQIGLALAQAYRVQGNPGAAIALLERLDKIYPGRESIINQLGEALLQANRAQQALTRLRSLAQRRHAPLIDRSIAKAAIESGVDWLGHKHLAEYYQANGRMREALEQLALAARDPMINEPAREEIKARREALEKLQREIDEETR